MATVRLEVLSWLTRALDAEQRGRIVRDEEIEAGATVRDLLKRLAGRYPEFGELVYDPADDDLTGAVSIIFNDRLLELAGGLDAEIQDGDSIVLLPAYAGGSQDPFPPSGRSRRDRVFTKPSARSTHHGIKPVRICGQAPSR